MKSKKARRPKLRDIHVWIPEDQFERIQAAADADSRSVTNFVRNLVLKYLDRVSS